MHSTDIHSTHAYLDELWFNENRQLKDMGLPDGAGALRMLNEKRNKIIVGRDFCNTKCFRRKKNIFFSEGKNEHSD
jgi:hypothetical protein